MALTSWVASANDPATDFPVQNLPYGVFLYRGQTHIGIAIGDQILDLHACASQDLFAELDPAIATSCIAANLNPLMALGSAAWSALRAYVGSLLDATQADRFRARVETLLVPMRDAEMLLPVDIGDYTDFYASIHHATRVGKLFRPDNPLLPNYKYVPIGYHGRASSVVVSGQSIRRPSGQTKPASAAEPVFGPSQSLDYELEVGIFTGPGNRLGEPIPIACAEDHIFGLCLLNDWSARDIQSWEYQPLGPFLAKSFATTISPWIVPLEALVPYRASLEARAAADPPPLPHLASPVPAREGINLTLEVFLESEQMRTANIAPMRVSAASLLNLYWSPAQLIAHHTSNGCNLRPGDLLGTGTVSGPTTGSEGCLLEMRSRPEPLTLPNGETRAFLHDGDTVTLRAHAQAPGQPRIGFGSCTGTILPAN
ncbi:MAG TPA: fumarylacetoacetase [Terracidiphilus sp.]|jgi:fumarylacetoacetase|nr:fumarylacetoacetase [Terracidiphilus sp.]